MPGQKNREISAFGYRVAAKHLAIHASDESSTGYLIIKNSIAYPVKVFTKTHEVKQGMRLTGKNQQSIEKLAHIHELYIVFVDASVQGAYGEFLTELMKNRVYLSSHAGTILYFDIDRMRGLFKLSEQEKAELAYLIFENANDKNQTKLF